MTIRTIWNKTIEGRQYWVQVKNNSMNLELISDLVSELAGGGYSIDLPYELEKDPGTLSELRNIFGEEDLKEIIAFSRTLKNVTMKDLNDRNKFFYHTYYCEYEKLGTK